MFYNTLTHEIISYAVLKSRYPLMSWPADINNAGVDVRLNMNSPYSDLPNWKRLNDIAKPSTTRYQNAVRIAPHTLHSQWVWDWQIVEASPEERIERDEILFQEMKDYRDNYWENSTIEITGGAVLQINQRTRRDVSDTMDGMITAGMEIYEGWNAVNGLFDISIAQFQEAKVKALMVVKKAFDAYNSIRDIHLITPYEGDEWMNDFDGFVEES